MTVEATLAAATESEGSSSRQSNFQTKERLDIEIESIGRLMMKVSQKQQTTTRKQRNFSKRKTRTKCESIVGGKLQNKVWKPGSVQWKNNAANRQQQSKVWDPRGKYLKAHDQEIMINFNLGSLMQGHQAKTNSMQFYRLRSFKYSNGLYFM